jgi:hypothetical protein
MYEDVLARKRGSSPATRQQTMNTPLLNSETRL